MWRMPAGRNRVTTATAPCRVPAKYSKRGRPASRIAWRQRVAFVDVEERLMLRVVGEHHARSIATMPGGRDTG